MSLRSIPSNRSWSIETPQTGDQKQPPRQRSEQRTKQTKPDNTSKEDTDTPLELWFHVEEIGQIAALIVSGMETREAVRAMPRYNRKKHRDYTAFYEQLKEAMNLSGGER